MLASPCGGRPCSAGDGPVLAASGHRRCGHSESSPPAAGLALDAACRGGAAADAEATRSRPAAEFCAAHAWRCPAARTPLPGGQATHTVGARRGGGGRGGRGVFSTGTDSEGCGVERSGRGRRRAQPAAGDGRRAPRHVHGPHVSGYFETMDPLRAAAAAGAHPRGENGRDSSGWTGATGDPSRMGIRQNNTRCGPPQDPRRRPLNRIGRFPWVARGADDAPGRLQHVALPPMTASAGVAAAVDPPRNCGLPPPALETALLNLDRRAFVLYDHGLTALPRSRRATSRVQDFASCGDAGGAYCSCGKATDWTRERRTTVRGRPPRKTMPEVPGRASPHAGGTVRPAHAPVRRARRRAPVAALRHLDGVA